MVLLLADKSIDVRGESTANANFVPGVRGQYYENIDVTEDCYEYRPKYLKVMREIGIV